MGNRKTFDFGIFITVLILLSIGITMVFSASSAYSFYKNNGDSYKFLRNQLLWACIGFVAMTFMVCYDYRKLGKYSALFLAVSIALLIIVLILPANEDRVKRWILFKGFSIQPSEVTKIAMILFFSYSLSKHKDKLPNFYKGLVPYLLIMGFIMGLLMLEPHLSATVMIACIGVILLVIAGAKIKHFAILSIPAIIALTAAIIAEPYRLRRLTGFFNPFADIRGDTWQIVNSLYAIGSGSWFGKGLGRSLQKFLYIPEPHNDFIFAIFAEETGFIGAFIVILLFLIFIWRGMKVAINAPDLFGSLLAAGITSWIAVQMIINIAVVTSSMPVTGMQLPFFSYGGSSLLFLMTGVGILLNISRYNVKGHTSSRNGSYRG